MNKKEKLLLLLALSAVLQTLTMVPGKDDYPKAEINETRAVLDNNIVKLEIHKVNGSFRKALLFPDPESSRALAELEIWPIVLLRIGNGFKRVRMNLTEAARVGCNCPGADVAGLVLAGYVFIDGKRLDANYLVILRKGSEAFEVRFTLRGNGEFEVGFVSVLTINASGWQLLVPGLRSPPPPSITAVRKLTWPALIFKGNNGVFTITWSLTEAGPIQPYFNCTSKGLTAGLAAPSAPEWIEENLDKCVVKIKRPYCLKPYPLYDSKLRINFKLLALKTNSLAAVLKKLSISAGLLSRNLDVDRSLKGLGEAYVGTLTKRRVADWVEEATDLVKALYGYISYTGELELEQRLQAYMEEHLEEFLSDPIIAVMLGFPKGSLNLLNEKISKALANEKPEYVRYLVEAYTVLGNRTLLTVAKHAIDKNGVFNLATAEAALLLYRITGVKKYLKLAEEWAAINLLNVSMTTGLYMLNGVADLEKSQELARVLAGIAVSTKDEFWTNSSASLIADILNITGNHVLVANFPSSNEDSQRKNITTLNLLIALEILAHTYPYLQLSHTIFLNTTVHIGVYGEIAKIVTNDQRIDLLVKGWSLKIIVVGMIPEPADLAVNSSSLQNDLISHKYVEKAKILIATVKAKGTANITLFFHETPNVKVSTHVDSKKDYAIIYLNITNNGGQPTSISVNVTVTGEEHVRTVNRKVILGSKEHKMIQLIKIEPGIYKLFIETYADGLLVYEDVLNIFVPRKQETWPILAVTLLALLTAAGILLKYRKHLF